MFIEPKAQSPNRDGNIGWIEVICGSMFSGKTEELIRRVNRATLAQQKVKIFKPAIDTRYDDQQVVSHNANKVESIPVSTALEIAEKAEGADVIAIDEAQFFGEDLPRICAALASKGYRVIASGLDMDFEGKPFGPIPALMCQAEYVTKLHAICMQCGDVALFSFRLSESSQKVLLGEKDIYEARCRKCFLEGMQKKPSTAGQQKIWGLDAD